jgi:hypothetical protein
MPTPDQVLALFKTNVENPRTALMTAVELRAQFDLRNWDRAAAPAVRDRLEAEGKLKVHIGSHNTKLTGLPEIVDAYEKQLVEVVPILQEGAPKARKIHHRKDRQK